MQYRIGVTRRWPIRRAGWIPSKASANATTTPGALATPFTFPAPTIQAGAVSTPTNLSTPFTIRIPTVLAGATTTPSNLATPFSFPAATVTGGATVTPSRLQTPFTFPASSISTCDVTDAFTRADGNIGSNYMIVHGSSIAQISSNHLATISSTDLPEMIRISEAYGSTQSSAMSFTPPSTSSWAAEVMCRCEPSHGDGYYFNWDDSSGGEVYLFKRNNFSDTVIGSIVTGVGTTGTKRLTIEASGTTINGYVDGVLTCTGTDATYSSGSPGFGLFSFDNTHFMQGDDFCGNGVVAGAITAYTPRLVTPFSFPAPSISVGGATTATPTNLSTPFSFPSPTVTATATSTPTNLATPFTFPAATLLLGATTVPSALATNFAFPSPTITGAAVATLSQLQTPFSFPVPTIVIANPDVTVSAPRLQTPFSFPSPHPSIPGAVVSDGIHVPFRVIRRRRRHSHR